MSDGVVKARPGGNRDQLCARCDELGVQISLTPGTLGVPGGWECPGCGRVWLVARTGASRAPRSLFQPSLIWRLHGPAGTAASCWMRRARDGTYLLTVYEHGLVSIFERHRSQSDTVDRCTDIWHTMSDQGWVEIMH